ncbi:MAG: DUF5003 domain-containing protein [Bacteroidaceae bacterium]|nr:DUF5003 domain-containing protein [Bacteroidaceae bacterium]
MKNIVRILKNKAVMMATLSLAVVGVACHDEEQAPAISFPETQILNCTTGETQTLEFDAAADWQLTSTQSWCKFVQDGKPVLSTSGKAGRQTVTLSITDEGLTQGASSVAQLTIYMLGQSGILAEITRSAAGYELKVYDADGNELDYITVGYNEYETFQVKANFAFAATTLPDWAELRGASLTGAANRLVEGAIRVVPDGTVEKNECEGTLLFQDMKGMASFSVRVVYQGMDREAILISQPGGNAWNWKVSADGQTWTHDANTYDRFITCSVSAYHDDYEIVYVEDADGKLLIDGVAGASVSWMHFNKTTGRLTADATDVARKGYVLAFPRTLYTQLSGDLAAALIEEENGKETLAYRYGQNNLVAHITQDVEGNSGDVTGDEIGFKALCFDENWEMLWIDCKRITDKATLDHCETIIGTREVFLLDTPSPRGHFDQVRPWPLLSNNDDLDSESAYFVDDRGNVLADMVAELSFSDSETPSYWYIMGVSNTSEPIYLVLKTSDGEGVMKVLKINTK